MHWSFHNAGQKKRNSELRIFHAPADGGGPTVNTVRNEQKLIGFLLVGSSQKIYGSAFFVSGELTKNLWISVAFLLTSIDIVDLTGFLVSF